MTLGAVLCALLYAAHESSSSWLAAAGDGPAPYAMALVAALAGLELAGLRRRLSSWLANWPWWAWLGGLVSLTLGFVDAWIAVAGLVSISPCACFWAISQAHARETDTWERAPHMLRAARESLAHGRLEQAWIRLEAAFMVPRHISLTPEMCTHNRGVLTLLQSMAGEAAIDLPTQALATLQSEYAQGEAATPIHNADLHICVAPAAIDAVLELLERHAPGVRSTSTQGPSPRPRLAWIGQASAPADCPARVTTRGRVAS